MREGRSDPDPNSPLSPRPPSSSSSSSIRIFYHLFVKGPEDEERGLAIAREQLSAADLGGTHDANVSVTLVGHRPAGALDLLDGRQNNFSVTHYAEGGEDLTLHALWNYCRSSPSDSSDVVVYLHSKGSFHPREENDRLRRFLTEGALSRECATLPDDCDVCSSRFSPLPHPHTSGNMWLARCDYVRKLRDPCHLKAKRLPRVFNSDKWCVGTGRYFFEHWIHSHPSVRPCDLYPGEEFVWSYEGIPDVGFDKVLKRAPRFNFDAYLRPMGNACGEDARTKFGNWMMRKWLYSELYNATELNESWYLWEFLNATDLGGPTK
ncbi:hypothetical protein ACHAWF_005878 [Thalassiosira exigua]